MWRSIVLGLGLALSAGAHAADVFNGQRLYRTHCQICHGTSGRPDMAGTPDFSRGDTLMRGDLAVLAAIADGRRAMPGYRGLLSNEETLDVIAYLRTLQR